MTSLAKISFVNSMRPCVLKKIKTNHQYCVAQSTSSPLQVSVQVWTQQWFSNSKWFLSVSTGVWGAQAHASITGYTNRWICVCSCAISQILKPWNGFWDISHPLLKGRRRLYHLSLAVKLNYTLMTICPPPESRVYLSYKPWTALHEASFPVLTLSRIFQTILRRILHLSYHITQYNPPWIR